MAAPRLRQHLKRIAVWTAVFVLLLALYVASCPFVIALNRRYDLGLRLAIKVSYAPTLLILNDRDAPRNDLYLAYAMWCQEKVAGLPFPAPPPRSM